MSNLKQLACYFYYTAGQINETIRQIRERNLQDIFTISDFYAIRDDMVDRAECALFLANEE